MVVLCFVFVFVMHFQIWTCFPLLGLSAKFVIYLLHVHTSLLIHWIFFPLITWGTDFTSIVCLCMLEFVSLSCRQMDLFGVVFVFTSFSTVCRLTDFSIYCFLLLLSSFCVCVVYSAKLATEIVVVFRIHSMHWVCLSLDGMTTMSLAWTAATTELSCRVLLTWQRTRAPLTRWVPLLHSECTSYTVSFYIVSVLLHSECTLTQWVYLLHSERTLTWWVPVLHSECPLTQWVPLLHGECPSYTVSTPITPWVSLIHWVPLLHGEYPYYTMSAPHTLSAPLTWWVPLLHHECPSYTVSAPLTLWVPLLHSEKTLTWWVYLLPSECISYTGKWRYIVKVSLTHWVHLFMERIFTSPCPKNRSFEEKGGPPLKGILVPVFTIHRPAPPTPHPPAQDVLFNPLCVWISAVWFSAMNPCCWFHSSWQCSHGQT